MWSDMLIKPLHGQAFCEMHAELMNVPNNYDDRVEQKWMHSDFLPSKGISENPVLESVLVDFLKERSVT